MSDFLEQTGLKEDGRGPYPLFMLLHAAQKMYLEGMITSEDLSECIEGIKKYKAYSLPVRVDHPDTVWKDGNTELLSYKASEQTRLNEALFIVPSLINGASVLNLQPQQSFVRWFAEKGYDVYWLNWGDMRNDPTLCSLDDVILQKIIKAGNLLLSQDYNKVHGCGYCMGGTLLALAASVMAEDSSMDSYCFIASPWDFSIEAEKSDSLFAPFPSGQPADSKDVVRNGLKQIEADGYWSADWIKGFFMAQNIERSIRKFITFNRMTDELKQNVFVATEAWLNGGSDIPREMSEFCLRHWVAENLLLRGKAGADLGLGPIHDIQSPAAILFSKNDHLVPYLSCLSLKRHLAKPQDIEVETGHIGMMVSTKAPDKVWLQYLQFLRSA